MYGAYSSKVLAAGAMASRRSCPAGLVPPVHRGGTRSADAGTAGRDGCPPRRVRALGGAGRAADAAGAPEQPAVRRLGRWPPDARAARRLQTSDFGLRTSYISARGLIQPQRTNNLLERFFRNLKRDCRHKSGCHSLGRTLRTLLADTPLVKNLQSPEYVKILLNGQPTLEALFAQIDPATVRRELAQAQQNSERVPRALKRFIARLPSPAPIKNFLENAKSNRVS